MVKSKFRLPAVMILSLVILILAISASPIASAEEYRWQVNYQHVTLDINQTGKVDMMYQVDADIVKGVWNEVWIPATKRDMQVYSVVDEAGKSHSFTLDTSDMQIKVQGFELKPGDHVNLQISSTLPGFVYQSDTQGYDIVSFTPPWWDMSIPDTSVKYLLPAEINTSEVFTGNRQYSGIGTENGRTMVYFNSTALSNNQQFDTAVSFPDSYMNTGVVTSKDDSTGGYVSGDSDTTGGFLADFCGLSGCLPFLVVGFIIFMIAISAGNRKQYSSPVVSMDGVGINKDLAPVEAAMLLRIDPRRILTMIMFDLMKKGNVKLISTEPVRLEPVARKDLNYYETAFMDSIKGDELNEDKLVNCFKLLAKRVVDKTRPFCRKDTETYYTQKIEAAWNDVKAVETPELKLQKYDTAMLWLMADEQFATRTKDNLRAPGWDTMTIPSYYWWYPVYFGQHTTPTTMGPATGQSQTGTIGQPQATNQTTSSVESFASKVSNSVESVSAGVVGSVESLLGVRNAANAPPPATTTPHSSSSPSSCASCACACVSCACACACAGGGGGCT